MRVLVAGDCPTAKAVRGQLARHDFHLTGHSPHLTVRIEEETGACRPLLDSVDCELEQAILRHLRRLTSAPVEIRTAGGVESDREVRIVVPPIEEERRAVEVAVFRALVELSGQDQPAWKPWWEGSPFKENKMNKRSTWIYMAASIFLLLVAAGIFGPAHAQLQQSGGPGSAVTATQAGTWNVNNISGTVSLPTGAATAAKQPALGTAGTPSADVITVQGAASMTPLTITGSISNTGFNVTGSLPAGANVIGQVQTVPKTARGTTAFTPAWQAVPTSTTSLTATTSCVAAMIITNTNGSAQTVTITDGQGSPVTIVSAFSIPANSQVTFPLYGSQMTSGIKWSAGGTGLTGTVVAYQ